MKTQPPSFPRGGPDSAHEQAPLLEIVGVTKSFVSAPLFESLQIPTQSGQSFQCEAGRHSELMSATIPI
jgi:hypothetical protein